METKLIWLFMFVGSTIGGFTPLLWGGSTFSIASVLFSAVGGILGIWLGYRLSSD